MAILSATLPVPSANGPGAAVNVAALGKDKTVVIAGDLRGVIDVEGSIDGVHWAQIPPFFYDPDSGEERGFVVQFMRAVTGGYYGGSSVCTVGAPQATNNFVSIPVPVAVGPGPSVPVGAFGSAWTILAGISGPFRGAAVIEISHDGASWAQVFENIIGPSCQSGQVSAEFVRVNKIRHNPVVPGPLFVSLGAQQPITSGSSGGSSFPADCQATDAVGEFVYVTSAAIMGIPQVSKCDITVAGKFPAIGLIVDKPSATTCIVQVLGEATISPATLVPGKAHFVGFDAKPTAVPPVPGVGFSAIQPVGTALDTGILWLNVFPQLFIKSP